VDTGAELLIIPATLYEATPKQMRLEPSFVILRKNDSTAPPTNGEIIEEVTCFQV